MKFINGWAFPDADEFMFRDIKPDGTVKLPELNAVLRHVTDWSIAIDGGANAGTWSRQLNERFARVIAVEPARDTCEALRHNMRQFGCSHVEVKSVALGSAPGFVSMHLDEKGERLKNTGARFSMEGGDIPVETIDSWHLPSLGLLKLDVEGSEAMAIRGAKQTIKRCRPVILYEEKGHWRRFGLKRGAVEHLLTKMGYRLAEELRIDRIWTPAS